MEGWTRSTEYPPSGIPIMVRLKDGRECEGHFIKNANRFVMNVNRYRLHDGTKKTYTCEEVSGWRIIPQ